MNLVPLGLSPSESGFYKDIFASQFISSYILLNWHWCE
jgi:hypothetical protein